MKGDFTRFTFRPDKHYTGVYMQQGRLQLDSDWNEQVAIQNYRFQNQLYDVIGLAGIPDTDGNQHAFEISPNGDDFTIAPGRIYVDGILCQLENSITYKTQPDYPNAIVYDNLANQSEFYLVYLDVWERHITAIEDPEIREVALNGLDTTTRTKTIVQVKLLPLSSDKVSEKDLEDKQKLQAQVKQKWENFFKEQKSSPELIASKIDSTTISDNHLYRIEIHTPGTSKQATFKWSRDNGNVVSAIETIKDDVITISQKNAELWQSSQPDQWIEIIDDSHELAGKPGTLTCLKQAFDNQLIFDKTRIIGNSLSEYKNPGLKVRRWDYTSDTITAGIPIPSNSSNEWIVLGQKEGIKVQFQVSNGSTKPTYRTGDYWLIPTRAATNDIDWHGQSSLLPDTGSPATETEFAKPREGIYHHYCKLAVLKYEVSSGSKVFKIIDEFQKGISFSPLTKYLDVKGNIGISKGQQSAALHVQSSESKKLNDLGSIFPHNPQDPNDSFIDLSSISLQEALHPGDLMTIPTRDSNKVTVLITNVPDAQTLKVFPPIGGQLQGEVAAKEVVYQQPIARFDSNGKTHVIVTANGHFGVGTQAPTASLTIQGDSEQQPIAHFVDSTGNTRIIVTRQGNLEVGTASLNAKLQVKGTAITDRLEVKGTTTTDRLIARGFVKTDKLITREFEATTFRGNCFKLRPLQPNPAEPDFGFIQAQAPGGHKEIQFVASKDVNFAFSNGNVKITPPNDAPSSENPTALGTTPREPEAALTVKGKIKAASLQLGDSTTITGFSDDFATTENQGIVPTGIAVRNGLQNKANINGALDQSFQTQNLTVNGSLKFAGKEIEITEFSNDFTLSKERAEKAIPTLDSIRGYVDGQLGDKASKAGQETEDFEAQNLGVHGNLTVSGTTTIGTEEGSITEKLSIKGKTTTNFLTVGDRLRNNNGSKETVLQVEGVANFTNDIRYKGSILQESSRQLKEDITEISSQEISELLKNLNPIKFRYISDQTQRVHIGFLSEEAPETVASSDRQAVSISDILGILVQAVKEQRQATKVLADVIDSQKIEISKLQAQVKELEEKKTHRFW